MQHFHDLPLQNFPEIIFYIDNSAFKPLSMQKMELLLPVPKLTY